MTQYYENNETADKVRYCKVCDDHRIDKIKCNIEIYKFASVDKYTVFSEFGAKSYYKHLLIRDIERVFDKYDTLQWDDMFTDFIYN